MKSSFELDVVDVPEFLEALRVRNVSRADMVNWRFSCPFTGHSHGDENASAYMRDDDTRWFCHGCKRAGNAVTFLSEYESVPFMEARRWLRDHWGGGFVEPEHGARHEWEQRFMFQNSEQDAPLQYLDESVLDRFRVDWEEFVEYDTPDVQYMFNRGFTVETLNKWQIGYDDISKRITIPIRDEDGRLVGFKGRAWWDEAHPKYLSIGDKDDSNIRYGFPTYEKSIVVFGLDRVVYTGELILVEGELNAIAMHQKGWTNAVSIAGSYLSPVQAMLIRQYCDKAIIFFDTDEAGLDATWGWTSKNKIHPGAVDILEPFMQIRVCPDHEGDPADMDATDIAACVNAASSSVTARPRARVRI